MESILASEINILIIFYVITRKLGTASTSRGDSSNYLRFTTGEILC